MIDILLIALYIAITAVFMTNYNQPYFYFLNKIKMNRKPLNCALCFSFWLGVVYTILMYTNVVYLLLPYTSAMLAILIEKVVKMLPLIF